MAVLCSNCGAQNDDWAASCSTCGELLGEAAALAEGADALDKSTNRPIGTIILLLVCGIYLLNPLFGVDVLPDNLPLLGNLDEAGVTALAIYLMSRQGWISVPGSKKLPPTQ